MDLNLDELLNELPITIQNVLKEVDVKSEDPMNIVFQMASMPGQLIALKGGGEWGMQWWEKFQESMKEFLCSNKKGCLNDLVQKSGPLKPSNLIQSASVYVGASCGIHAGLLTGFCGAIIYQVFARGKQSWCDVVLPKNVP